MVAAVIVVTTLEPFFTVDTFQHKTPSDNSPKQCPIVYHLFAHDIPNKFLKVECAVWHMLLNDAAMKINEDFSLGACQPILGLQRKKFVTVCTPLQHVS